MEAHFVHVSSTGQLAVLDQEQIEIFKKRLLRQQQALLALKETSEEGTKTVVLDQSRVGRLSRMDALQEQAMSRERERRRQLELEKIATALRRIEAGEYGYCVRCDEAIATKRLELDPAVPLCIACASQSDEMAR